NGPSVRCAPLDRFLPLPGGGVIIMRQRNFAAAIGGWSARHRWWALLIWVVFVAVATVAGNAVGTAEMERWEALNGDSREALRILDEAGFPRVAGEFVLVQARQGSLTADDPRFRQAVLDVKSAVEATRSEEHTSELQSRENLVCRLLLE